MNDGYFGEGEGGGSYGIGAGVFLLGGDDGSTSLGGVEGSFTADNSLTLGRATFGLAADFGDGIPVVGHSSGGFLG